MRLLSRILILGIFILFTCQVKAANWLVLDPHSPSTDHLINQIVQSIPNVTVVDSTKQIPESSNIITFGDAPDIKTQCGVHIRFLASPITQRRTKESACRSAITISSQPSMESILEVAHSYLDLGDKNLAYILPADPDIPTQQALQQEYPDLVLVPTSGSIFTTLNTLRSNKDIKSVLVSSSYSAFKANNVILSLESLYRKGIPVISTSSALIGKGAVLVIYIDQNDALQTLNEVIADEKNSGIYYPRPTTHFDKRLAKLLSVVPIND